MSMLCMLFTSLGCVEAKLMFGNCMITRLFPGRLGLWL